MICSIRVICVLLNTKLNMEILITLTYTALFIFIILKMNFFVVDGISKRNITLIYLLKIVSGFALWGIYTFYYTDRATADIYKYFDDSNIIFKAIKTNPIDYFKIIFGIGNNTPHFDLYYNEMHYWARQADSGIYNDSHTIIRFNALVRLFSFGCYHVHTVVICFLSLVGLTAIYKTFVKHLKDKKRELLFAVFLLPSVIFWGSGVLKEGLIFFALGLLVYNIYQLFTAKAMFICSIATILLALSKFYIWLAILPCLFFLVWENKNRKINVFLKYVIVIVCFCLAGLNIDKYTSIQNPMVTLSQKQLEFNKLASGNMQDSNFKPIPIAGSVISINKLEPTFTSFIKNAPSALINVFFRPFPWELKSAMMLLAGFENLLILSIIILCIFFIKSLKKIKWAYVLFCLSFVIIQFLIIGETTPILGAITRYKTIALPFLIISFLFIFDKNKIIKNLPFLKKILN